MSAVCISVETHTTFIRPSDAFSVTNLCRISICRVRLFIEVPLAKAFALILSPRSSMGMGSSRSVLVNTFFIQQISRVVSVAARYSASVVDKLMVLCFLDFQIIAESPYKWCIHKSSVGHLGHQPRKRQNMPSSYYFHLSLENTDWCLWFLSGSERCV